MNTSKRDKPTSDILIQYVLDYGLQKTCDLFHITEDELFDLLHPKLVQKQYKYNTVIDKPLHKDAALIAKVIAEHFEELKLKYTMYGKNIVFMAQDVEDFFLKAVVRCMETGTDDLTEEGILLLFKINFSTIRKYSLKSYYTMKEKLSPLELKNEDGDFYLPNEYNKSNDN